MDDWEAKRIISLLEDIKFETMAARRAAEDIKSTVNLAYFGTIAVMLFWAAVGYISKLF
jgi:hypothetical protein